jgi:hypothetical protein
MDDCAFLKALLAIAITSHKRKYDSMYGSFHVMNQQSDLTVDLAKIAVYYQLLIW